MLPLLVLGLMLATALAAPAVADDPDGFTVHITPEEGGAGTEVSFTATVANPSEEETLELAATLELPDDFRLVRGTPTLNASLEPGESTEVEFDAVVACQTEDLDPTDHEFVLTDVEGADFLDDASGLAFRATGVCTLRFSAQPTDAQAGVGDDSVITSKRGDPDGDPVEVEVVDAGGEDVTTAPASVSVSLLGGSPDATLGGVTEEVEAEDGVAVFNDLTVDTAGRGYTLEATSKVAEPATSHHFHIWELIQDCVPGEDCSAPLERPGSMSSVIAGNATQDSTIYTTISDDALDCGQDEEGYPFNHAPGTVIVDSDGFDDVKIATITIDAAVVTEETNNGAAFYQVCFESFAEEGGDQFVPRDPDNRTPQRQVESDEEPTFGPGLLLDCQRGSGGATPPCVDSRRGTPGGGVEIVVLLPPGDPMMR